MLPPPGLIWDWSEPTLPPPPHPPKAVRPSFSSSKGSETKQQACPQSGAALQITNNLSLISCISFVSDIYISDHVIYPPNLNRAWPLQKWPIAIIVLSLFQIQKSDLTFSQVFLNSFLNSDSSMLWMQCKLSIVLLAFQNFSWHHKQKPMITLQRGL